MFSIVVCVIVGILEFLCGYFAGWNNCLSKIKACTHSISTNNRRSAICPECGHSVSVRDLEALYQCPHCKVDYPFVIRGKQHPVR